MNLRFLLDTSIVSEPRRAAPDSAVIERLSRFTFASAIASPVWHELRYGAERMPPGGRRREAERMIDEIESSYPVLPYDAEAADWHAHERARLDGLGMSVPHLDGQIAAVAATNDLVLVTKNVRDFERFEGLRVEDWSTKKKRR